MVQFNLPNSEEMPASEPPAMMRSGTPLLRVTVNATACNNSSSGPHDPAAAPSEPALPPMSPKAAATASAGGSLPPTTPHGRQARQAGDHEGPSVYAVPRFPPGHTSAAFDALAVRKSLILTPPEVYAECAHHGEEKAKFSTLKLLTLSVIAGCYVGFGFTLCLMVGGNLGADLLASRPGLVSLVFGVFGFPAGFTMIVTCGAELFTSLCAYAAAAWWEGKVTAAACVRLWVVSWLGNFAGCAIFMGLIEAAGMFEGRDAYLLLLAARKVHHGFGSAFVRAIFANWLVGIATWQANAAQDMAGKVFAIWLPISMFAALGFEHVIANQYLLPLALARGAHLPARDVIVNNLIPATLGNWVGGAVCVASVYALAYGLPSKRAAEWLAARSKVGGGGGGLSLLQQRRQRAARPGVMA